MIDACAPTGEMPTHFNSVLLLSLLMHFIAGFILNRLSKPLNVNILIPVNAYRWLVPYGLMILLNSSMLVLAFTVNGRGFQYRHPCTVMSFSVPTSLVLGGRRNINCILWSQVSIQLMNIKWIIQFRWTIVCHPSKNNFQCEFTPACVQVINF